jgi:hypothetical protein
MTATDYTEKTHKNKDKRFLGGLPITEQPARTGRVEVQTMKQEQRLLPVVQIDGAEYLVDVERRQFVVYEAPELVVDMHSEKGRILVEKMHGMEWRAYALEPDEEHLLEV